MAVVVNLGSFNRFRKLIDAGFDGRVGPVKDAFVAWGKIYRSAMRRRFIKLSRTGGGSEWKPLKLSTILARRHGGKGKFKRGRRAHKRARAGSGGGKVSILRDTGTLLNTLSPQFGLPGQIQKLIRGGGLKVGIGGSAYHPGRSLTIGQLAVIHHFGVPKRGIPARPILVRPDTATVNRMARALDRGIKEAKRQAGT